MNLIDTTFVTEVLRLIFVVAGAAVASGWTASGLTQLLKWKAISYPASKYPAPTAVALSILLAIPAVLLTGMVEIIGLWSYVVIAFSSILVATQTYDTVKKIVDQLKQLQ